ncbi:MAG: (2Fe-2S) ferredoxin domain-containing protein, partial [Candidatus Sericytochromatia bacterium]
IDDDSGDSLIKLETTHCLGQCNFGPNIRANGKTYTKVDKEILKRVLSIMKAKLTGLKNDQ